MINRVKRNIVLYGALSSYGATMDGVQNAPDILRRLGLLKHLLSITCVTDNGNVVSDVSDNVQQCGVRNFNSIIAFCNNLKNAVKESFLEGSVLLTIGGDHSISLGTIAGLLEHSTNVGVIWFDAHTDINTETTSPTSNAHGMPLTALLGLCSSQLDTIRGTNYLRAENIFWLGTRSIDDEEKDNIEFWDNVYSYDKIRKIGFSTCLDDILRKIHERNITHLHISFDVDAMDPQIMPATGVPVDNGLMQNELDIFSHWLGNFKNISSVDFVEYNPVLDDATFSVGQWCVATITNLMKNIV